MSYRFDCKNYQNVLKLSLHNRAAIILSDILTDEITTDIN